MDTVLQDVRFALRMLLKSPGFAVVAVIMLALGIGANTAIFSLTDQVLLRQLPVQNPEQLVVLRSPGDKPGHTSSDGDDAASFSYPLYKELRDQNHAFSGLLTCFGVALNIAGQGATERAHGELVSGNYFDVLGVPPALGRVFSSQDETAPGANPVAVLSYGYWARRYGRNPAILNQQLTVNGTLLTVVGVARAGFTGVQIGQTPDVFVPITMKPQMTPNWNGLEDPKDYWLAILGRLQPGMTRTQAQAALQPLYHGVLASEVPLMKLSADAQHRFLDRPLLLEDGASGRPILQADARQPLLLLVLMVSLVLLIACANLASLLVARGEARQREIAVRLAVGAARWRLVRQLFTENLLLALLGGAAGILVAAWTLAFLVRTMQESIGVLGLKAQLDGRILAFAIALSLLTALLFGLLPAWRAARTSLQTALKDLGSSVSHHVSTVRLRKALIIGQVALTVVLLTAAGLFTRSLLNLQNTNLGLRTDHLMEFSVAPELNRYSPARALALVERLRQAIAAAPGVSSVSAATIPILSNSDWGSGITIEGYTARENEDMHVWRNDVGPDYFSTLGTPLLAGREFRVSDAAGSPKVAIVNATFVRRFLQHRNPLGVHIRSGAGTGKPDVEIVGVVKDSKHSDPRDPIHPFLYEPYAQDPDFGHATFYVRSAGEPAAMADTLRKVVAQVDPNLPVYSLETLVQQIDETVFADRLLTFLSLCMGLLAAVLAAIGLYGVMAYMVARRTREIGIRMALGATRENVAAMVLREVARLAGIGLGIGLAAALAADRLVASLLYGVRAADPVVFAAAVLLLAVVALLAGGLPARRAATVDPVVALRYE
ncbi:MAG TPA: ABC transporter permease [Terriglobales bacterium]|nr:ABC transporter permease [Terriglobales bacterium]